ncbi:MAG: sn-glycerol-3-phosphate ABC transporter ATP-binding protein UgpC [Saprospiraceae bacterium]|nr:sn-glycerol-3-phosphate ABC transporter ATP-binding protein UgpC [Saprospiraceae bacterium]
MAGIEIKNLEKTYANNHKAIKGIDVSIKEGEFVVLVGPSGCGKSTLLRMIAGLEDISGGDLFFDSKRMNEVHPKDRNIAMVFQNYALYPHMTVYENMAFGLTLKKMPKAEIHQRVTEAATTLGITEYLDRLPKEMSGGQRQRVAIGRAIVRQPDVFLFDEPLSNLDAKLRVQMRTEIKRLHGQLKNTMVYVTHDQIEAMAMGDKIVILKDGYVHQIDTPVNVFNHPKNKFVAGFIGSPAMNFVSGKIERQGELHFINQGMKISIPEPLRGSMEKYVGKTVDMGFRTEYVYDKGLEKERRLSTDVDIEILVVENVGSESYNYFKLQGMDNIYSYRSSSSHAHSPGEKLTIGIDLERLHFFDTETDETIL